MSKKVIEVREIIAGKTGFRQKVRSVTLGSTRGVAKVINLSSTKLRPGSDKMMEAVYCDGSTKIIDRLTFLKLESKLGV